MTLRGVSYNVGGKSSDITDTVADTVARIDAMQRRIQKQIKEYLDLFEKITKQIDEIEKPVYREILTLRYAQDMSLDDIGKLMHYGLDNINTLARRARAALIALHPEIEKL